MQEAYAAMNGKFEFLAIAVDENGDPRNYVKQQGFTFTSALSPEAPALYNVSSIPLTLFIDRQGNVVESHVGGMDRMEFENKLSKIL